MAMLYYNHIKDVEIWGFVMRIFIGMLSLLFMVPFNAQAGDKGMLGALLGAGAGAAIGHSVDRTGGSGKGAVIGAIGGYVLGSAMEDKDARKEAPPPPAESKATTASAGAVTASAYKRDCTLAQDYFRRGYDAAASNADKIYYLQKGLQYCPTDVRAQNDLGVAYYQRGGTHDRDRARAQFQAALRLDPSYQPARQNLNSL